MEKDLSKVKAMITFCASDRDLLSRKALAVLKRRGYMTLLIDGEGVVETTYVAIFTGDFTKGDWASRTRGTHYCRTACYRVSPPDWAKFLPFRIALVNKNVNSIKAGNPDFVKAVLTAAHGFIRYFAGQADYPWGGEPSKYLGTSVSEWVEIASYVKAQQGYARVHMGF